MLFPEETKISGNTAKGDRIRSLFASNRNDKLIMTKGE